MLSSLYFSALPLTVTCCLLLDLYPLEEGLAQYIKSRRKLGLTLTGLVPLNASGILYQLEKGLRNKSQSCLLSSAIRLLLPCTETPQHCDLLLRIHSRLLSLPTHYLSIMAGLQHYGFPVHRTGSCKGWVQTPRHRVYLYSKRPCLLRPVCNTPRRGSD